MAHSTNGVLTAYYHIAWEGDGPVTNFVAIARALEAVAKGKNAEDFTEALDAFIEGDTEDMLLERQNAVNEMWERGIR